MGSVQNRRSEHIDRIDFRRRHSVKRISDLVRALSLESYEFQGEVARSTCELGAGRDRVRVGQHGDPPRLREKFMQDFESFYIQL